MNIENTSPRRSAPTLAIVIPFFNEHESLPLAFRILKNVMLRLISAGQITPESFLYFVDDGSSDDGWRLLSGAHASDTNIKGLKLSRNFGHQAALMAGLMAVKERCDACISIDADLQQDPEAIIKFIEEFRNGSEMVFGVRNDRTSDGLMKHTTAIGFYKLMELMGVRIIPNHADYRLLSARAMVTLAQYSEPDMFLRAICVGMGFKSSIVSFDVKERQAGKSKYPFMKMLKLAIDGITSFSIAPLRMIAILGGFIFIVSIGMTSYIAFRTLVVGDTVPGWASTTLPIYFLGGIQILCMGIMGEYLAQIVNAVKKRPRYICEAELL